jgi:hypothetical protein
MVSQNRSTPASSQKYIGKVGARRRMCGPSEQRSGEAASRGNTKFPGSEGVGEHVRTRSHSGLWAPVKLRISLGGPHRTKKTCFFCRIGLKELAPSKDDPAV